MYLFFFLHRTAKYIMSLLKRSKSPRDYFHERQHLMSPADMAHCCTGKSFSAPRMFTLVVGVLIFGVVLAIVNVYELHKMRYGQFPVTAAGSLATPGRSGMVVWLHGTNRQTGYLKHVEIVFERIGYTVVYEKPAKWDVFWSHSYPFSTFSTEMKSMKSDQKVNHFPGTGFITNKVSLATLNSQYIPRAFMLPDEKEAALNYAVEFPDKMFVKKSNQHRGISVQKLGDIDLDQPGNFVQEFVSDPFLVDGHKFDIGVYVAVTSVNPLRVYVYEGDILFRFCSEKYQPFDPVNLNKYVVGDDYLPIWDVQSLKHYYTDLGMGMKGSFDAYLRSSGRSEKDITKLWRDVMLAIQEIFLLKEPAINKLVEKYPYRTAFFEMMRFDFVLDGDLNPFLMEANMSPNLSSGHFPPNKHIYEQVLFNLFSVVGLARKIHSDTLRYRSDDEEKMEVSDKDITVFSQTCASERCSNNCGSPLCKSRCVHCMSPGDKEELKRAFREHVNRGLCRRIIPMPMTQSDAEKDLEVNQGLLEKNQWMLRWFRGMCLRDPGWCQ